VSRHTKPFAPKHVGPHRKIPRSDRASENANASAVNLDPKNKKARQILADRSGYLAFAGPATSMAQRMSKEIFLPRRIKS
jgi:hypothetical protein